jgi:hypothetical protein
VEPSVHKGSVVGFIGPLRAERSGSVLSIKYLAGQRIGDSVDILRYER